MINALSRPQIVERVIADRYGRQFRAIFQINFVDGVFRARLVRAELITETIHQIAGFTQSDGHALPFFVVSNAVETPYIASVAPVASPYFDTDLIINSQPTRAPADK